MHHRGGGRRSRRRDTAGASKDDAPKDGRNAERAERPDVPAARAAPPAAAGSGSKKGTRGARKSQQAGKSSSSSSGSRSLPPNFFVAIRVHDTTLRGMVQAAQEALVRSHPTLARCVTSPRKLHFTAFVLRCDSEEEVEAAKACMERCRGVVEAFYRQIGLEVGEGGGEAACAGAHFAVAAGCDESLARLPPPPPAPAPDPAQRYGHFPSRPIVLRGFGGFGKAVLFLDVRRQELGQGQGQAVGDAVSATAAVGASSVAAAEGGEVTVLQALTTLVDAIYTEFVASGVRVKGAEGGVQAKVGGAAARGVEEQGGAGVECARGGSSSNDSSTSSTPAPRRPQLRCPTFTPHITVAKTSADRRNGRKLRLLPSMYVSGRRASSCAGCGGGEEDVQTASIGDRNVPSGEAGGAQLGELDIGDGGPAVDDTVFDGYRLCLQPGCVELLSMADPPDAADGYYASYYRI